MGERWRVAQRRRGRPRHHAGLAAACLAAVLAGGCDVRDETVRSVGASDFWPPAIPTPATQATGATPAEMGVDFVEGYAAAVRRAGAEDRPLLLVFGAAWCRWTGELARGPLADRDVVARTRPYLCAFVDADRDAATCREFGVTAFPTVIVIDAAGQERFRASGAASLVAALDAAPPPGPPRPRLAGDGRLAGEAKDVPR